MSQVKTTPFISFNKDALGFIASMLCAVHCLALPFILTISTLSGLSFLANHTIEWVFIAISIVLATASLFPGYFKHHFNPIPLRIVAVGFAFLVVSRMLPHSNLEHVITGIGGLLIAFSHYKNWKLMRSCC